MSLDWLADELEERRAQNLLRSVMTVRHLPGAMIEVDGRLLSNFGANDYLGLTFHPRIIEASEKCALEQPTDCEESNVAELRGQSEASILEAAENSSACASRLPTSNRLRADFRFGSGASPLVSGYTDSHAALEKSLAEFEGTEAAVLFSTGYAANVGTIAALASEGDIVFSDALNHASIIDGCRLSRAKIVVYPHGDTTTLAALLTEYRPSARRAFIVTDSLFSMDGDIAPLNAIVDLADQYKAIVIVDEAHATGVYGYHGRGIVEELGLESRIPVRIGTLSKALGCLGGFVVGSHELIDFLRNFARTYIYSTAMPIPLAYAAREALELAHAMQADRSQLRARGYDFRKHLRELGLKTSGFDSPIVPVYFETPGQVLELSSKLRSEGYFVPAIRPPTVPSDRSLLRVSLSTSHSDEQICGLVEALRRCSKQSSNA